MKTIDEILEKFDTYYEALSKGKTKDFTLLIETLESLLHQMKVTREVSLEVKKELEGCSDEEFTLEASKRLEPQLKKIEAKRIPLAELEINMILFQLPDKKGKIFFQIMKRMEEAGKLPLKDPSKREMIDTVMTDLEKYIQEIKEISEPFVLAPIDKSQTIIFKVMFRYRKGIWRKIEMKASQTLEDLHDAIQDAIDWDNDHLYSFFMDNSFDSLDAEFTCPYEPEGRKTADIAVGAFGFKKGQKFAYLFDFGDMHKFEIEVIDFGTVQKGKSYPMLIESKGKTLEQYPDYDE